MRNLARRIALKTKAKKQPSYDPYSTCVVDGSGGWAGLLPVKVISVPDPIEDDIGSAIQRGMLVLELVGATGLVVGVDESAERIDLAEKRATVAGRCYWTRFITADLNTFIPREHALIPHERYDVVVVARVHMLQRERATLLRVSTWLRPDGVIIITDGKPAGSTNNRSLIWGK